jgi:hypothetical protein
LLIWTLAPPCSLPNSVFFSDIICFERIFGNKFSLFH